MQFALFDMQTGGRHRRLEREPVVDQIQNHLQQGGADPV